MDKDKLSEYLNKRKQERIFHETFVNLYRIDHSRTIFPFIKLIRVSENEIKVEFDIHNNLPYEIYVKMDLLILFVRGNMGYSLPLDTISIFSIFRYKEDKVSYVY
jgi:hypothetical protein